MTFTSVHPDPPEGVRLVVTHRGETLNVLLSPTWARALAQMLEQHAQAVDGKTSAEDLNLPEMRRTIG